MRALALSLALSLGATSFPSRAEGQEFHFQAQYVPGYQSQLPVPTTPEPGVDTPKLRLTTTLIMAGVVGALIVWDVIVAREHGDTESQIIKSYAWQYSIIPYVLGILIGHWLFNHSADWSTDMWPYALASAGAVLAWDLLRPVGPSVDKNWTRYPGIWFAVGVPVGAFFWGQRF